LKRRLLIALLVFAVLATGLIVTHERAYRRASCQGKHTSDWAAQLYTLSEPRGTNAAAVAFRAMSSNAVPALRALVNRREPRYEKTFLKYGRQIPVKPRTYLFQKLKPGRTIEYRLGAIQALGLIGPNATAALPELLEALAATDSRVRWMTAQNIAHLGPDAIAALIPLLTNADVHLRHAAVYALGEARTNALPAAPALIYRTMDTNESVRASAYYSLSRIGQEALPGTIAIAVTNANAEVRNAAFRSLIVLLPPPGRVPNSLLTLSTNTAAMRRLAILSLNRSRLTNDYALALYQAGLEDEDSSVREATQRALARLNPTNRGRFIPP